MAFKEFKRGHNSHGSHCTAKFIPMQWQQHGALSLPPPPGSPASPRACWGKRRNPPQNQPPLPPAPCPGVLLLFALRDPGRRGWVARCSTKSPYFCPNNPPFFFSLFFFSHPVDHSIKNWQQPLCQRFSGHREWKEGKKVSLEGLYMGTSFAFRVQSSEHDQRSKSPRVSSKPHFPPPKLIRISSLITRNWLHVNSCVLPTFTFYVARDGWRKPCRQIRGKTANIPPKEVPLLGRYFTPAQFLSGTEERGKVRAELIAAWVSPCIFPGTAEKCGREAHK